MRKTVKIIVRGRVQGVGFRFSAMAAAERLGVKLRTADNRPDGSVYLEAVGEDERLERFLEWARHGSPLAAVESVVVS